MEKYFLIYRNGEFLGHTVSKRKPSFYGKDVVEKSLQEFKDTLLNYGIVFMTESEGFDYEIKKLSKEKAETEELLTTSEYVLEIDFKLAMLEIMG